MTQMTSDIKDLLQANISYFSTASKDNKPNVVPVGLVEAINDSEVVIVDILFNKTRKNLIENPHVALAITDIGRLQAYQLKGKAEFVASGPLFEKSFRIMEERSARRNKMMEERFKGIQDPVLKKKHLRIIELHKKLKPKAIVLVKIENIYSTMQE